MKKTAALTLSATTLALALALAGCAGEAEEPADDAAPAAPETTAEETPDAEPAAEETDEETDGASAGGGPAWAAGATDVGDEIGSFTTDSWEVDLFQVGTTETESDSMFVDPDTNENILPAGSEVVIVNFVATNTSDAAIDLSISLSSPSLESADWKFMSGQPGASHSDLYEALDVSDTGFQVGEEAPFTVEPGESFAVATSIEYVAGEDAVADVTLTPADAEGELLHDLKEEGETTVTIQ